MKRYSLTHVADGVVERGLTTFDAQNKTSLAALLAHLAEFEARRLFRPTEYPSLRLYCMRRLHWCEQAALKRIRAARLARRFPAVFAAVADGRLHLSAVLLLGPRLRPENAAELLAAAAHQSRAEIELLLAERFPREDVPTRLEPVAAQFSQAGSIARVAAPPADPSASEVSPGTVVAPLFDVSAGSVAATESASVSAGDPPAKLTPLSPGRYSLQVTVDQETRDLLQRAADLMSHRARPGDVAGVLKRALDEFVTKLEQRKCGAAARRGPRRASRSARHIPAHVREAVWKRDGGRCTFVSEAGRRCESREQIEYDHVVPVARGGVATVEGTRLLCRQHNQFEAERTFGAGFMEEKRAQARRAAEAKREAAEREADARREAEQARKVAEQDPDASVIPWLRSLGVRADQAKRAAEAVAHMADAPLEERVKTAFAFHASVRFPNASRPMAGGAAMT